MVHRSVASLCAGVIVKFFDEVEVEKTVEHFAGQQLQVVARARAVAVVLVLTLVLVACCLLWS